VVINETSHNKQTFSGMELHKRNLLLVTSVFVLGEGNREGKGELEGKGEGEGNIEGKREEKRNIEGKGERGGEREGRERGERGVERGEQRGEQRGEGGGKRSKVGGGGKWERKKRGQRVETNSALEHH